MRSRRNHDAWLHAEPNRRIHTSSDDTDDQEFEDFDEFLDGGDLDDFDDGGESEIPSFVTQLLEEAVRVGASAVHLEPMEDRTLRVRFRVGTGLRDGPPIPRDLARGVVGRLKVLGQMDVAERRLPQWGEFTTNFDTGPTVTWRVVTLPGTADERITIHVSPLDTWPPRLDAIVAGGELDDIRAVLDAGRGLILAAGPRWSGADRLLDACVREAVRDDRAVVSIVEARRATIPGVHEVVARPEAGMDTAVALRTAVRSAVDVIHVHALLDAETMEWAVNGSLNGALVLASIPTSDGEGAVLRLLEAHIAPGLVAEALSMVVGVRRIRALCPSCRKTHAEGGFTATGCDVCGETGYQGTVPVHHGVRIDGAIRRAVRSADAAAVVTAIRRAGTLRDAALKIAASGEISMADAIRETPDPER